ncbi:MAG: DUF1330 domain-containing protein [Thermodesulfobacteriota bacterium]
MSAYLVAFADVKDVDVFQNEYGANVGPITEKYNGKIICVAPADNAKEGSFPAGNLVIVEFPDMSSAEGFYNDPDYQPLIKVRQSVCDTQLGLFPGIG